MQNISQLVSPCGLFCGACYRYKKGKCPGCTENIKATWCKIRNCSDRQEGATCADCTVFGDVNECSKFNTIFSKFFYYIFKSDRKASLKRIAQIGIPEYAEEMAKSQRSVIKRN